MVWNPGLATKDSGTVLESLVAAFPTVEQLQG
jgi:hypothetical protein